MITESSFRMVSGIIRESISRNKDLIDSGKSEVPLYIQGRIDAYESVLEMFNYIEIAEEK